MVAVFIKITFYRIISPACLIFAALIRPSLLSLLYALLALLNPLFPRIRASYPLTTPTKVYLTLIVLAALGTSICQLVYQIVEHVIAPEDSTYVEECKAGTDGWRYWLRQLGFTRVPSHEPIGFRFMLPEIVALISSLATLVICLTKHESSDLNETVQTSQSHTSGSHHFTRLFNRVKLILIFYAGLHLLILYTYQIQVSKDFLHPDHIVARLLGFTDLARSEACETWWQFKFNSYWTAYVNYIALWVYFFCSVTQFNWTRTGIRNFGDRDGDDASSDHEEFYPMNELASEGGGDDKHVNNDARSDGLLASVPDLDQGPNSVPLQRITSAVLDRQKISVIFRRPGEKETTTTEGLTAITFFFLHHSYVFQLIAMMTWALLYHSVFGLIFLFLACILWALRDSRKWCFRISPIMLAYVEILLIFQYVYSLDLIAGKELPVYSGLEIIGFQQAGSRTAAFLTLGVKSILSLPFFVILRLFLRERFYDSLSEHDRRKRLNYGTFTTPPVNREPALQVQEVHTGTQFPSIPKLWQDKTNLTAEDFAKIGLVDYQDEHSSSLLFVRLLLPILLVLVTMLQLKFFHDPWTKLVQTPSQSRTTSVVGTASEEYSMSDEKFHIYFNPKPKTYPAHICYVYPEGYVEITRPRDSRDLLNEQRLAVEKWAKRLEKEEFQPKNEQLWKTAAKTTWQQLRQIMRDFAEILWRLAEVHLPKLVLLILIITASSHICVLNFVLVFFVSLAVCLPALSGLISLLLTVYLALSTVTRVVYLGLVIVMVVIAIQLSVRYRQRHIRRLRAQEEPAGGLIFPYADPAHFDRSVLDCLMFFFNYGFYKFGLEVSMIMMAIVAWARMDILGCIIIVWLFMFALLPRRAIRVLWPIFLL
uniref:Piezo-type mechanosensitive ion channel component n=1 Tax=Panagrolaimus sp. ES5 TaxID=591445 RepID=A0AC34GV86_9BILA